MSSLKPWFHVVPPPRRPSLPPGDAASDEKAAEIKAALRELGLADDRDRPS